MKIFRLVLVAGITFCSSVLHAQRIYIDETVAKDEEAAKTSVRELIAKGQMEGMWLMCDKRFTWSASDRSDTLSSIQSIEQKISENDLASYALQQMQYGRLQGNIIVCGHAVKWKTKSKDAKRFDLVVKRVPKRKMGNRKAPGTLPSETGHQEIQSIFELETILRTELPVDVDNYDLFPTAVYHNRLWIYKHDPSTNAAATFIRADAGTLKLDSIKVSIPAFYQSMFSDPEKISLAVNDSLCVIGCDNKVAVFTRNGADSLAYLKIVNIGTEVESMQLSGQKLFVGRLLTSRERKDETFLGVFDLVSEKWISRINPPFKLIEFSHSYPHDWMHATENSILVTQTRDYEIAIYDYSLNKTATIRRDVPGWKPITDRELNKMDDLKYDKAIYSTYAVDSILSQRSFVSYIVNAKFINESRIIVCYLPYSKERSQEDYRPYLYDIWVKENGEWKLQQADLEDKPGLDDEKATKQNFPFNAYRNMIQYHFTENGKVIGLRLGGKMPAWGKPYSFILKQAQASFMGQDKGAGIYIYNVK